MLRPLKKGQKVWICYTGDRIWRPSHVLSVSKDRWLKYEVEDYLMPGAGELRIGRKMIRIKEPKGLRAW